LGCRLSAFSYQLIHLDFMSVRHVSPLVAVLALLAGCSTYADRLKDVRAGYFNGDLVFARQALDQAIEKEKRGEADVLKLERAMVELAEGRPQDAERTLREVRDRFDELEGTDLGEQAWVMLSDDNAQSYGGEDYEKVLVRAMLAISNLLGDGEDAHAYALQVIDKQQEIIDGGTDATGENPKLAYQRVALGPYLHGVVREATHANYDDAARSHALVCSWQPDFKYGAFDVQRAVHGRHSAPGNGVLYVFAFVGAGPMKVETVEVPSQIAMLIADRVLSHNLNQTLPPTIAPIKVPKVVRFDSPVSNVRVSVNQQHAGVTETVTDVGMLAAQQYEAIYQQVIARAIVRRAVKKGIIYGAKEAVGVERGSLESVAFDVAGIVWEATESADTRSWGLLPDKIQVLRIELPAGRHQLSLQPFGPYVQGAPVQKTVDVANGDNTYLLCNFPSTKQVGQVVVSGR
jgi:hypothetical protein